MQTYDYVIIGSGLWGATFAHEATKRGLRCLVVEKRGHIGGNIYTRNEDGIHVHEYGAHIFNTSDQALWEYIQQFAPFHPFINTVYSIAGGQIYPLPFNLMTIQAVYGSAENKIITPAEGRQLIQDHGKLDTPVPRNLEEHAISLVGREIYERLIKGYTEKQWGKKATDLPPSIMARIPFRFTYDNNYYNTTYQGIPEGGYTQIIEKMLAGCDVLLDTDYFQDEAKWQAMGKRMVYTGMMDAFYHHRYGPLEYRSLRFETTRYDELPDFQGNAVINYADAAVPYTRIIEHKHFERGQQPFTLVTREYPIGYTPGRDDPYYPINDEKNTALYQRYRQLAEQEPNVIFGGRLGRYQYTSMQDTLLSALGCAKEELERRND